MSADEKLCQSVWHILKNDNTKSKEVTVNQNIADNERAECPEWLCFNLRIVKAPENITSFLNSV